MTDATAGAASRLTTGSGGALAAMAFFAVLREGFEVGVFVLALIGAKTSNPLLGTLGAVAGVAVAVGVGIAVVRGGVHFDIARFFRATAFILVLGAAGLAMTAIHAANAGGWVVFAQMPQFDWSRYAPPGTVLSLSRRACSASSPTPCPSTSWCGSPISSRCCSSWCGPAVRRRRARPRPGQEAPAGDHRRRLRPGRRGGHELGPVLPAQLGLRRHGRPVGVVDARAPPGPERRLVPSVPVDRARRRLRARRRGGGR